LKVKEGEDMTLETLGVYEYTERRIIIRKFPFLIWTCAVVAILTGLYLIYHLALGHFGALFEKYREGYWWQYLISFIVLGIGIAFLWGGEIDSLILDKQTGIISKVKTNVLCNKQQTDWGID
jgi:uncharacterized membrane protein